MYYEDKRSFYIKQYGPAVLIIGIALVLIITGIVIGLKDDNAVAKQPVESNAYVYTDNAITGTVTKTKGLTITVTANNTTYDINLIGIMQHDKNPNLSKTIASDLTGKTVTIDYDIAKTENNKTYAYLYVDGTLYNETLLAQGLAELRTERQNINKLDILVAAQIKARYEGLGIWKY